MLEKGAPKKQVIRRVSLGDMRHLITINTRTLNAVESGVEFGITFTLFKQVYAYIETVAGEEFFDGTTLKKISTHNFVIRFIDGLTAEYWINYQNNNYEIIDIETLDERGLFMKLRCLKRGDDTKPVNYA